MRREFVGLPDALDGVSDSPGGSQHVSASANDLGDGRERDRRLTGLAPDHVHMIDSLI